MATAISTTISQGGISPLEALWSLYQSQNKRVRKAFRVRVLAEETEENEKKQMAAYEQKLTLKEKEAAYRLVDTIKKGVADVHTAIREHKPLGRSADEFLEEMQNEGYSLHAS